MTKATIENILNHNRRGIAIHQIYAGISKEMNQMYQVYQCNCVDLTRGERCDTCTQTIKKMDYP